LQLLEEVCSPIDLLHLSLEALLCLLGLLFSLLLSDIVLSGLLIKNCVTLKLLLFLRLLLLLSGWLQLLIVIILFLRRLVHLPEVLQLQVLHES
jgi:hypothetical protein